MKLEDRKIVWSTTSFLVQRKDVRFSWELAELCCTFNVKESVINRKMTALLWLTNFADLADFALGGGQNISPQCKKLISNTNQLTATIGAEKQSS